MKFKKSATSTIVKRRPRVDESPIQPPEERAAAPFVVVLPAVPADVDAEAGGETSGVASGVMSLPEYLARHGVDALSSLGELRHPVTGEYHSIHALVVDVIVRSESVSSVTRGKARDLWALACEAFERPSGWRENSQKALVS